MRIQLAGAVCAALAVMIVGTMAQAQSPSANELLRRLEAAERRIHELEGLRPQPHYRPANAGGYQSVVDDRLDEFEASLTDQAEALSDVKSSVGKKVSPGHSGAKMKVVGRVHVDYWSPFDTDPGINFLEYDDPTIPPQARLNFRRMRFGVRGTVGDQMEYRIEMEFAGGNESEFRDAWLGWNDLPVVQTLLVGNQKRPYGLDHLNSSRYNVFIERPFVIESFNQDARRLGICAYGVSDDLRYNWRYGVYNQELIQATGNYINNNLQLEFAGRFANTIWYDECSDGRGYAHWAVSGTYASPDGNGVPVDGISPNQARFRHRPEARTVERWLNTGRIDGATDYGLLGLEGVINVGPFQWVGEYQNVWLTRSGNSDLNLHGGYTYVSYFLTGEHIPWSRKSGTLGRVKPFENFFLVERCRGGCGCGLGAWQVALRWSYADFNDEDIFGGRGESLTFGLNWHWTPYARMQFNYIVGEIKDRDADNNPAAPVLVSGDYKIFGTRLMIDF